MDVTRYGWPRLMSREVAAAYLNIGARTLDRLQADHKVIPKDVGGGKRFDIRELDRYVDSLPDWE